MTDTSGVPRSSFGVGKIAGDSFSIFFRHFFWILLLSLLPIVALFVFGVVMAASFSAGTIAGSGMSGFAIAILVIFVLLIFAVYFLMIAMIVRLSYDARTGHPVRIGSYFSSAIGSIVPIFLTSIIMWLCMVAVMIVVAAGGAILGTSGIVVFSIAGIIGATFLYVSCIAAVPSIVVENQGISSLARSMELTSGYRWQCLGAIVIMFLCVLGVSLVLGIIQVAFAAILGELGAGIVSLLSSGLSMALTGIFIALIYARLREIKEGTSVESLAEIFA